MKAVIKMHGHREATRDLERDEPLDDAPQTANRVNHILVAQMVGTQRRLDDLEHLPRQFRHLLILSGGRLKREDVPSGILATVGAVSVGQRADGVGARAAHNCAREVCEQVARAIDGQFAAKSR